MKILILAAHPDDEVLGCGGTAARLSNEGHEVTPVIVCENASVRYGDKMKQEIEQAAIRCAEILGIVKPVFLGMPDQKLDTYPALEMAKTIERVIEEYSPEIVFTHHGGDINKDHQVLFEATMVAVRPTPDNNVRSVYTYETISATEWAAPNYHAVFTPNTFYDISATLNKKIEAFSQYTSELNEFPHPRSKKGIEVRAEDWGARVGIPAAEAFQLIRSRI